MKKTFLLFWYYSGFAKLSYFILSLWTSSQAIRVVNLHGTPKSELKTLKKLISKLSLYFEILKVDDLEKLICGELRLNKLGLIFTFDDGLESNYWAATEVLNPMGVQGVFFVPSHILNDRVPIPSELDVLLLPSDIDRFMNKKQIKELAQKHHIGVHSNYHKRLGRGKEPRFYEDEIVRSKEILEKELGRSMVSFAWVGGEFESYSREASVLIEENYKFSFRTNNKVFTVKDTLHGVERTNIEVTMPWYQIFSSVTGLYDLLYLKKRRKLKKILG